MGSNRARCAVWTVLEQVEGRFGRDMVCRLVGSVFLANRECVCVMTVVALFRRCAVGSQELVGNSLSAKTAGALSTSY